MPCSRNVNNHLGGCNCCQPCQEQERPGGCERCCKCIPEELCATFTPDDATVDPTASLLTHYGDGEYHELASTFSLTITLDEANCEWDIVSGTLSINQSQAVRGQYGIGCRAPSFNPITTTFAGEAGSLSITIARFVPLPNVPSGAGCREPACAGCECLPECICIEHEFGPTGLGDPEGDEDAFFRRMTACWDADRQAWIAQFPEVACAPALEVKVEILDDGYAGCGLFLTTDDGGATRLASDGPAFDCFSTEGNIGSWEYGNTSGSYGDPGHFITAKRANCGDQITFPCRLCCQENPATLFATLVDIDDCIDPEDLGLPWSPITISDVPLTSSCPNAHIWTGEFEIQRCDDYTPVTVQLRVTCEFCTYREAQDKCVCTGAGGECHNVEMKLATAPTWTQGTHVSSECDPFFAEFEMEGFHGQTVTITVTE